MRQPAPTTAAAEPTALARESRATAERYNELDRDLGHLEIRSAELASRITKYRAIAQNSARALNDVALALEKKDAELARRRRVEFDALSREEAPLVAEINAQCAGR